MVWQRRLDYGFHGFEFPFLPRGPRSARGKRSGRSSKNQLCAFELLASVAGELLVEENSPPRKVNVEEGDCIVKEDVDSVDGSLVNGSKDFLERQSTVSFDKASVHVNRDDDENSTVEEGEIMKSVSSKFSEGDEFKPIFRCRRLVYTRQRTQKSVFKRRKLFDIGVGRISDSEGNGSPSSVTDPKIELEPEACRVKLGIKSFKVPELLIDLPETATIGSLKRTVLDALTALLCDDFCVGVQVQGKKLRDDSKTLVEAGICHGGMLQNLSFTLDPKRNRVATPSFPPLPDGSGSDPPPTRCPADVESEHDSAPSPLAVVPAAEMDVLALVPYRRRRAALPRRIRRPFSVGEVEALVRAVEKLGTGRWRDVKLCAFEDARHRTYVDLKDKWKTLVHTATISPQQRRGEPVPQELLDRVLAANGFWSHHAKRPSHPGDTASLLA